MQEHVDSFEIYKVDIIMPNVKEALEYLREKGDVIFYTGFCFCSCGKKQISYCGDPSCITVAICDNHPACKIDMENIWRSNANGFDATEQKKKALCEKAADMCKINKDNA